MYATALRELTVGSRRLDGMEPREALRWQARLTALQAIVRQGQQRPVDALEQARRAIDEAERSGERHALGQAYGVRAWASLVLGLPDRTGSAACSALAIFEELGDLPAQATYTNSLGAEAYFEGRWDDALAYYQRAKDTFLRSGNPTSAAYGSMNSGEILVNQGRLDEAEPLLREAQRVLRASGAEDAKFAEIQLGRLLMDRGDLEGAERSLTHAQIDAAAIGLHDSALEAAVHLADCHLRRGTPHRRSTPSVPRNGRSGRSEPLRDPGGQRRGPDPVGAGSA